MKTQAFSEFVGTIYDAAFDPGGWDHVLQRFSGALKAKAASIHLVNPVEGKFSLFVEFGTDPAWTALLLSQYANMSPIGAAVLLADLDQPVGAFDFIDENEFVESRFYKEWCKPQGYHDMIGGLISKRPSEVGSISATRSLEAGKFSVDDREFVGLVTPHVRRAVTLSGLLGQQVIERQSLSGLIDQLAVAVLLVDKRGQLVRSNPAGERELACANVVSSVNRSVSFSDHEANRALGQALSLTSIAPQTIAATGRDGHRHLVAVLLIDAKTGTFAVLINRQEEEMPQIGKHLARLYGLTPREVCVLMLLLQGAGPEEAAASMGVAVTTVRSHLNSLFAKTGTSRQAELVQKALASIPPVVLA